MHIRLFHFSFHNRAVMSHHIPPTIKELKQIGHVEWPSIHVNISFHGNPSEVSENSSPYITNVKVNTLLPIKYSLPTLYHASEPDEEEETKIIFFFFFSSFL